MSLLRRLGLAAVPAGVVLDAMSLELLAELDVGGQGGDVDAGDGAVWFTTRADRTLSRIDPATRVETGRLELPEKPRRVTVDALGPIVLCEPNVIVRATPDAGAVRSRADVPEGVIDVVAEQGAVWALRSAGSVPFDVSLLLLDVDSLAPRHEVPLARSGIAGGLRTGTGVVCALVEDPPGSMRNAVVDIHTGEPLPDERAPRTRGIAELNGMRWVMDGDRGFERVDIETGRTLAKGEAPGPKVGSVTLADGYLWACNFREQRGEPQYMQ